MSVNVAIDKTPMTYAEREAIFSKDVITIPELARLLYCAYPTASAKMLEMKNQLKRKGKLRLDVQGKLHTQDYLEYFNLDGNSQRYMRKEQAGND